MNKSNINEPSSPEPIIPSNIDCYSPIVLTAPDENVVYIIPQTNYVMIILTDRFGRFVNCVIERPALNKLTV